MPHDMDEEGKETHPTGSSFSIVAWWRKFHFSGRVIACSVLLGLGLILIGGLIFAINITDSNTSQNDVDGSTGPLSTKAPSNYTGPIVMGIGGFIVITGVIMCLFETQVCRKKTGDSSPLISEKTDDPERNGSDPTPGPSTSHGHKSRKHGAHRSATSPKKTKSRHAKSRSKERNHQKNTSPKSLAVPIEPPKSFITSSEDNFLTPPNTVEENVAVVQKNDPGSAEIKDSSLMKSFTSSDPSWNQSAEFLTPSTSFRDTSVSLNNSVEIDENPEENRKNSTELSEKPTISPEYMTPLTVEEDRIQQLLIRVKNEQKQMTESKKETNFGTSEYSRPEKESNSVQTQIENVKKNEEVREKIEEKNSFTNAPLPESSSTSKDINQVAFSQIGEVNPDELSQNNYETNVSEKNISAAHKEVLDELSGKVNASEGIISTQKDSTSLANESPSPTSTPGTVKEASHGGVEENEEQVDLDSSVSSDETVVSPDSILENGNGSSNENSTLTPLKEVSENESKCLSNTLESSDNKPAVETDVDYHNNQDKSPQQDAVEAHDTSLSKNDDLTVESHETENESKDNAS